ncbi:glucosamine inositolphosphorylceramide transferase family protein [Acetobacter thailandicus]|uniref:glucosamine inositolphosphorylceramide transferase family protein n=1 Tax=Acetobacter thailandicus TaxID=1502842 RepID=UPI001BA6FE55|nr:hypothetical protein [Acetobacter thailandicus]MBS0986785.1 hypothetical protein [Acetobacter thailandicus]
MKMLVTELWRLGIVQAPVQTIAAAGSLAPFSVRWIEADRSLCFLADPFGIWRDNKLYLFAEAYDYRSRRGAIVAYVLDASLNIIEYRTVLSEPWHLSYPYVFEADGEIWMLPEGYKSGTLSLYRAVNFPWQWEKVPEFYFPCAAIDATPVFTQGSWWMFYTPPRARTNTLMLAQAEHLTGEWKNISSHPIREDISSARMGGTPFYQDGKLIIPVQDCSKTYGGAIRLLSLSPDTLHQPEFTPGAYLQASHKDAPFSDGLHTLSAAGDFTLIDTKRILYGSPHRICVDLGRAWKKRQSRHA